MLLQHLQHLVVHRKVHCLRRIQRHVQQVCFVGIDDSHKLTVRLFLLFQHHLVIVAVCHQHIHFVRIRQHLIECQVLYQFYRVYHLCNVADFQFCQSFVSFEFHSEISFNCYYYYAYI